MILDDPFQCHLHFERLFQRGRRDAQGLHGHIAFIEGGNELAPQHRKGQRADDQRTNGRHQNNLGTRHSRTDGRFDPLAGMTQKEGLMLL